MRHSRAIMGLALIAAAAGLTPGCQIHGAAVPGGTAQAVVWAPGQVITLEPGNLWVTAANAAGQPFGGVVIALHRASGTPEADTQPPSLRTVASFLPINTGRVVVRIGSPKLPGGSFEHSLIPSDFVDGAARLTIGELPIGTARVAVTIFDATSRQLGAAEATVEIVAGQVVAVPITVVVPEATGTASIEIESRESYMGTPRFVVPVPAEPLWVEFSPPKPAKKLIALGDSVFALSRDSLYKIDAEDVSGSWSEIETGLETGHLTSLDVDEGKIWLGTRNGIIVADALEGASWAWSWRWNWDGINSLDFHDAIGWAVVSSFGSSSGLLRMRPGIGWRQVPSYSPWNGGGTVVADSADPLNVAYASDRGSFRTVDGAATWGLLLNEENSSAGEVLLSTSWKGQNTIFTGAGFSGDRGRSWQSYGLPGGGRVEAISKVGEGELYVSEIGGTGRAIFAGSPGHWREVGQQDRGAVSIAATSAAVWVCTGDGRALRAPR